MPSHAEWTVIPAFDGQSREMYCSVTGQPARRGEPVYRGSWIDQEGFYDICQDSALQLGQLAGLVPPKALRRFQTEAKNLRDENKRLKAQLDEAHSLIEHLRRYDEGDEAA